MTGFIAVFRADASPAIGGGHVRRCLSLADALAAAGWEIVFAASPQTFETMPALVRATYRHVALPPGADEARELRDRIPDGCTLLVVDHYGREAEFERYCRGWAAHILVIDDLVDRRHDCDMLVDQTPNRSPAEYFGFVPAGCSILTGADYALLDRRFRAAREQRGQVPAAPRRVLVSFGWSDPAGATALAIEALICAQLAVAVDVVLGADGPSLDRVRHLIGMLDPPARLWTAVDDMAGLILAADLAIGAAGVSALERCCVGLPSIILPIADNQRGNAAAVSRCGAGLVMRPVASLDIGELAQAIRDLAADRACREAMSAAGRALCDGWGAERVCARILALAGAPSRDGLVPAGFAIRPARPQDVRSVWTWRNDPAARAMSLDAQPIPWQTHRAWYEERLASPDTLMLIASVGDQAIGVLRFDRSGETAEVSIAIAPERRGQGWGRHLLRQGCEIVQRNGFARYLEARIRPENTASRRIFEAAGFGLHAAGQGDRYRRTPSSCAAAERGEGSEPAGRKSG